MVNQYVSEYAVVLQHVWVQLDHARCASAAGSLINPNPPALKDLSSAGTVEEVDMMAAGQNIIELIDLVPELLQGLCQSTTLPKANAAGVAVKDHDRAEANIVAVAFASRFACVMKSLLGINEKKAMWLKVSLANTDCVEGLTKARVEFSVAPHINDSV